MRILQPYEGLIIRANKPFDPDVCVTLNEDQFHAVLDGKNYTPKDIDINDGLVDGLQKTADKAGVNFIILAAVGEGGKRLVFPIKASDIEFPPNPSHN